MRELWCSRRVGDLGWKETWLKYETPSITLCFVNVFAFFNNYTPFWKRTWPFIWIPFTKWWIEPSLVEIGHVVLEKKILNFSQCFFAFSYLSPLEHTWMPITQGCSVPSLVEIGRVVLEKISLNFVNVHSPFHNYIPFENGGHFIWTNLNTSPKISLFQVWLKLTQWFSTRRFLYFVNIFSLFHNYLPLEIGVALYLNKIWVLITKVCFVPNLAEIDRVLLEKKIVKFRICVFTILKLSPFWKVWGSSYD